MQNLQSHLALFTFTNKYEVINPGKKEIKLKGTQQYLEQNDRAVSTFLTETDLAGLKACSVGSSPSIVSVQSERGASCNSKSNEQSKPSSGCRLSAKSIMIWAEEHAERHFNDSIQKQ